MDYLGDVSWNISHQVSDNPDKKYTTQVDYVLSLFVFFSYHKLTDGYFIVDWSFTHESNKITWSVLFFIKHILLKV